MHLHPYDIYLKIIGWAQKRLIFLTLVIVAVSALAYLTPNPLTHECKPTMQTMLGVSPDRQDDTSGFCDPGYNPEMRFGLADAEFNAYKFIFFIILPVLLLAPVVLILTAPWINKKFGYYGGPDKDPFRMKFVSKTDQKIQESKQQKKQ